MLVYSPVDGEPHYILSAPLEDVGRSGTIQEEAQLNAASRSGTAILFQRRNISCDSRLSVIEEV
jgi:hypothetical protein